MEFVLWAALLSGFLATVIMTAMIKMSAAAGMTEMPSFELMTGSMMSGNEKTAKTIGGMIHYVMMGTILFGLLYAFLFQTFDSGSWVMGLAIGIVHGLVVGGMFMPMMPSMHPRMGEPAVVEQQGGEIHLSSPGLMGRNWGSMTPIGVLMGHAVYGVAFALLYELSSDRRPAAAPPFPRRSTRGSPSQLGVFVNVWSGRYGCGKRAVLRSTWLRLNAPESPCRRSALS